MGRVIVLDDVTANQIAAGEVVERPASVVKELVENSIDANASAVAVEIRNGGISLIRVTDNGDGFYDDDAELAFERFATSKLRNAGDLERVATLGFRGEALPSIAAVSKVRLTTRRPDAEYGRTVEIHGGKLIRSEAAGCPAGTTITVSELFFNVPARYKFLKKDVAETAQISDFIGKIAVGRPSVSFRLISQKSDMLFSPGNGELADAIFAAYGGGISDGLTKLAPGSGRIRIDGYVGKPEISRGNRNFELFFVNGRIVKNRILYAAAEEAYKTYLMKKKYPVVFLNIGMDAGLLDVNAHPAKTEIRFFGESELFGAIHRSIASALAGAGGLPGHAGAAAADASGVRGGYGANSAHGAGGAFGGRAAQGGDCPAAESGGRAAYPGSGSPCPAAGAGEESAGFGSAAPYCGGGAAVAPLCHGGADAGELEPAAQGALAQGSPDRGGTAQGALAQGSPDRGGSALGSPDRGGTAQGSPDRGGTAQGSPDRGGTAQGSPDRGGTAQGAVAQGGTAQGAVAQGGTAQGAAGRADSRAGGQTESQADALAYSNAQADLLAYSNAEALANAQAGGGLGIAERTGFCGEPAAGAAFAAPEAFPASAAYSKPIAYSQYGVGCRSAGWFSSLRFVGQVFDTYILLENGDEMIAIDQHAAHERIVFERLRLQYAATRAQSQMLLESIAVPLLADEMLFVRDAMPFINKAGFYLDEFGHDAVILREAPLYLERADIKNFFLEMLEILRRDIQKGKTLADASAIDIETLYDVACKAAIKANKRMSARETEELLRELDALQPPLTCPHGRPLMASMGKREFEKRFKRIL